MDSLEILYAYHCDYRIMAVSILVSIVSILTLLEPAGPSAKNREQVAENKTKLLIRLRLKLKDQPEWLERVVELW